MSNFTLPYSGEAQDNNKAALAIRNTGKGTGGAIVGIADGASAAIWGETTDKDNGGSGVVGKSNKWIGVYGESQQAEGICGQCHVDYQAGVVGLNDAKNGFGIFGKAVIAGRFEGIVQVQGDHKVQGDVHVTGDVKLVNADCAEDFDISITSIAEPGTVMILGQGGALEPSHQAYDKKVAGVISGAGGYKPGIILDKKESQNNRMPIALMGKVYCKVDASYSPIEVGDLLTTSPTAGHAMKVHDPYKAFGTVIGKALQPLSDGQGLIPVLVSLQ